MIVKPRDRAFGTINNGKGRTRTKKKEKGAANVRCRDWWWETNVRERGGRRKWQKEKRVSGKGFGPSVLDLP